ncbi:MAG: DUF1592 domain-containing protein [Acidobacteria bacterium]|nr:DUF1592 domain-containing protein [Acidobacteriota bacterium]
MTRTRQAIGAAGITAAVALGTMAPAAGAQATGGAAPALPAAGAAASSLAFEGAPAAAASTRALLDRYCLTCHNDRLRTAGLTLAAVDPEHVGAHAAIWEKVVRKLRTATMPPAPRARPDAATYAGVVTYLEAALDVAAEADPDPGRPAVQRLNRTEYVNAIRDLLALEVDGRALLPADESSYGFDNVGDVLTVSPGLLERYLLAAARISRSAVGDPTLRPTTAAYRTSPLLAQDGRAGDDLPFGSRGGLAVRHHFPLDAEYVIRISLRGRARAGHQLEVRLDRARVARFDLDRRGPLEVRLPVRAGTRRVGVSFVEALERTLPVDGRPPPPPITSFAFTLYPNAPSVEQIAVIGPYDGRAPAGTPSRAALFTCVPDHAAAEEPCAREILGALARRAYRRPVAEADVAPLLAAYEAGREAGGGFEEGVRWALEALLVSPKFLFRIEEDPAGVAPGVPYRIGDLDLASRLSFFLWSSIPDDELIEAAARGDLRDPERLEREVRRMLDDPRSDALVENFAGQWLYLRNLRTVAPDATRFPEFDDNLRRALRRETELFFESQLREDRGVHDLLRADYTFVNERLARHYGIPNVYGSHFRRVTHDDPRRPGLLGHGSILTVTSYPHRTSPVVRGKWLLENLLGAPPPPPPPDIPELAEDDGTAERPASMRERMAQHRASPACSTCHAQIDPLGFALENFDAVGRWRTHDGAAAAPIDASGALPDGVPFDGPAAFRDALLREPWAAEFAATVTEKLLTYALGRGLDHRDAPAVRKILRDAEADGYRWSSLILGIVESVPFRMRRAPDSADSDAPVSVHQESAPQRPATQDVAPPQIPDAPVGARQRPTKAGSP